MQWLNKRFPRLNASAGMTYRVLRLYASNGSLLAWGRLLRNVTRSMKGIRSPVFFAVGLTYRCMCRCQHCYAEGRARKIADELTTDEVKSLLDQAVEIGALEAFFSGGECLLRRDLPELIAHARGLGLLTRISTNGYLLDQKHVDALASAGLTQAGVSLDYADPEEHDRSRNLEGLHKRATEGIRRLLDVGIRVQMHCVTFRPSILEGVERVIALGKELGVSGVCLVFPSFSGQMVHASNGILNEQERAAVRSLQDFAFTYAELPTADTMCSASACRFLYVNPYGYASPCTTIARSMGNVRRTPMRELWERYVEGMNMPCRGDCILNDFQRYEFLKDYLAGLEAMAEEAGTATETAVSRGVAEMQRTATDI